VFEVPADANKLSVAAAVKAQFDVTVLGVNILNLSGKRKRTYLSRSGKYVKGRTSDVKKAYVTIAAGQNIPIFAADEEAEVKQAETAKELKKLADKAEKKAEKAAKPAKAKKEKA
jgi:large subunit ribosomal protein L23